MSLNLKQCRQCDQTFWPTGDGVEQWKCPQCLASRAGVAPVESEREQPRPRFVALSALPEGQRLPARRTGQATAASMDAASGRGIQPRPARGERQMPREVESISADPPRQLPAVRPLPLPPPALPPAPAASPDGLQAPARQLGFNCPSCFTVLIIKDPQNYDGRAAPCPYCQVVIIPPRVAPPSPFTLVAAPAPAPRALPAPEAAPAARETRWKPFDKSINNGSSDQRYTA